MKARNCGEPNQQHLAGSGVCSCRALAVEDSSGIALALGGGFSRGFAHLGVLEVLEQEHIRVSAIVGTSIGGLLGAAYADGIPVRVLCELGRNVRVRDFIRFQGKERGPQRNDCLGRFVSECFRVAQIEDLPIPTSIVTTDLNTGAPFIFTRGPLDVAIRATCAFPGLFKPVEHEGRLLADGCIVSPVPTAVAAQMSARCVLGVAVASNLKIAVPGRKVVQILDRAKASEKGLVEPPWDRPADLLVEPEVRSIDWNDFSRVDEARAAGADAMWRALPQLRKLLEGPPQLQRLARGSGGAESRVGL